MKTGLSYNTVSRMAQGYPGELESVVRFAQGYKQDVNAALTLAGYEPLPDASEPLTGAEILMAGIAALAQELGRPIRIAFDESTKARLTPEEAEQTLAVYRKQAADGIL